MQLIERIFRVEPINDGGRVTMSAKKIEMSLRSASSGSDDRMRCEGLFEIRRNGAPQLPQKLLSAGLGCAH